jgi:predicted nuclease with TOPRIM domain
LILVKGGDTVFKKLTELLKKMLAMSERFDRLEAKIDSNREILEQKINSTREILEEKITATQGSIHSLKTQMEASFAALNEKLTLSDRVMSLALDVERLKAAKH